jgi:hypothetical protein
LILPTMSFGMPLGAKSPDLGAMIR